MGGGIKQTLPSSCPQPVAISNVLTYLLTFTWYKQLVEGINLTSSTFQCAMASCRQHLWHRCVLPERVWGLRMVEHKLGIQKALYESDAALLLKVGGKLVLHRTA